MKILVIRNGGIGDTLLLTPFFQALRKKFSPSKLIAMGRKEALDILAREGIIDSAVSFEQEGIWGLYNETNRTPAGLEKFFLSFDRIFSFVRAEDNLFHRNLTELDGGEVCSASPLPGNDYAGHAARYYKEVFGLALPDHETAPPLFHQSAEDASAASQFFHEHGMGPGEGHIIAIHPGSGSRVKNWPLKGFVDVASQLVKRKNRVLWISGPAEAESETCLYEEIGGICPVHLPLARLVSVLKASSAYLGNDSGISHLAGLTGIPTCVIFGPTDPVQWRPLGPNVMVLQGRPRSFSLPHKTGEKAREREFLHAVSVEDVLSRLHRESCARRLQRPDNRK